MRLLSFGRASRRPAARLTAALLLAITTLGAAGALPARAADPIATETTLTSDRSLSVAGQAVTFTVTVTAADHSPVTGTVALTADGSEDLGTEPVVAGTATLTRDSLAAGTHSIVAEFTGPDPLETSRNQTALLHTVARADTSTTLTISPNPVAPGADVTFTAMLDVAAPADLDPFGGPQGSLQFTLNGLPIGDAFLLEGFYGVEVTFSAPTEPLTALIGVDYSGDANSEPSSTSLPWTVVTPTPPSSGTTPPAGGTAMPPDVHSLLNTTNATLTNALRKRGLSALTSARQTFNAPGPGVLDQKVFTPNAPKSALKAKKPVLIASASRKGAAAGPITFKLKATTAGKRTLRKSRSLKLAIVTRFTPTGGKPVILVSRLTAKAKAKRSATALFGRHGWRVERLDR